MKQSILVIDDNSTNIQLIGSFLKEQGYKTFFALDGLSGIDVAKSMKVDLILLDVMMPGIGGLEVCARLKADPSTKAIPIILLTALDQAKDIVSGFEAGCSDYVTKPFRQEELLARIRTHLELSRMQYHLEQKIKERTEELQTANGQLQQELMERKQAEEALEMSIMRSNTALQLTRSGHWHVPLDGSGWYNSSERAVDIFGDIPRPDLRYRIVEDWFANVILGDEEFAKRTWENFQGAVDGKIDVYDSIYAYKRPVDDCIVWIHALGKVVRNEQGVPIDMYGVTQDITAFVEAENVIRQLNANLERRVTERTQELVETTKKLVDSSRKAGMAEVAIGVLHNIGNALTGINIKVQNLRQSYQIEDPIYRLPDVLNIFKDHKGRLDEYLNEDPRGKKVLPFLEVMCGEILTQHEVCKQTLSQIIADISTVTQLVAKQQSHAKFTGTIENVSLVECVEDVLALQNYQMEKYSIKISKDFRTDTMLSTDRHKLLQILSNIVRNAVQATAANPGERTMQVIVFKDNEKVGVTVQDNGIGMNQEQIVKVFRYGYTTKKSGHGFGLHTSSIDSKLLGGELSCQSEGSGRGSSFTLILPIVSPHKLPADDDIARAG